MTSPSPVKVTRQKQMEEMERGHPLRRFSSNFVPFAGASKQNKIQADDKDYQTKLSPSSCLLESSLLPPHDQSGNSSVSISTLSNDGFPDLHHLSKLSKSDYVDGKGKRIAGVGRSASEEVIGTPKIDTKSELSVHSNSLTTINEMNQPSTISYEPAITKRKVKKARVIASRYMSATKKKADSGDVLHTDHAAAVSVTSKLSKEKFEPEAAISSIRQPAQLFRHLHLSPSPQITPAHTSSFTPLHLPFTPSSMTTSTPAHVHHITPAFLNVSSVGNVSVTNAETNKKTSKVHSDIDCLHTELFLNKLLQASYVDIMSARSLRLQEEEVKFQVHQLWLSVQEKRNKVVIISKIIDIEETNLALETAIEIQLNSLGLVNSKLHILEQKYYKMAKALDTTYHEMPFKRISPCNEDEMQAELFISEQLLGDITALVRENLPMVFSLTNSTEALVNSLENHCQELQMCWEELSLLIKTQVQDTSLFFEHRQRNSVFDAIVNNMTN